MERGISEARYECSICLSEYSLGRMVSLICGHTFCGGCIKSHFQVRRKNHCPSCRHPVEKGQEHPVYLTPFKPISIVEGLQRMDNNVKPLSVKNAAKRIEQVVNGEGDDSPDLVELLKAVNEFRERFIPALTEAERLRAEIRDLRELQDTRLSLATRDLETTCQQAILEALKAREERDNALDTVQVFSHELLASREEAEAARGSAGSLTTSLNKIMVEHDVLKRDKDVLQTELLEVKSRLSKRENDIKILKDDIARKKQELKATCSKFESQDGGYGTSHAQQTGMVEFQDIEPSRKRHKRAYTPIPPDEDEFEDIPPLTFASVQIPDSVLGKKTKKTKASLFPTTNKLLLASGPKHGIRIPKGR